MDYCHSGRSVVVIYNTGWSNKRIYHLTERVFDKTQHLFMRFTLRYLGIER